VVLSANEANLPLHEYQCLTCGRFEVIQKFSDSPLRECPTCGKGVTKLLSAPAIQFKGAGWYVTDYARKSGSADGGKAAESTSGSKDTGSKDTGSKDTSSSSSADKSSPSTPSSATSSASGSSPSK
jgi:putative FmdB family regulatory protein